MKRLLQLVPCVFAVWIGLAGVDRALSAPAPAASIPSVSLVQPAELAAELRGAAPKPLILQVGFRVLYDRAHIPDAEYAGPAREQKGLNLLRHQVAALPRNTPIVIYCGCCPWRHCPNIAPAYHLLRHLGFTRVKALYLADNFATDWVQRGYPTKQSR